MSIASIAGSATTQEDNRLQTGLSGEQILGDFAVLDSNNDKVLDSNDFVNGYIQLDEDSVFKIYDLNDDDLLSHLEAKVCMDLHSRTSTNFHSNKDYLITEGEALASFEIFDRDGDGNVTIDERDQTLREMVWATYLSASERVKSWAIETDQDNFTGENQEKTDEIINELMEATSHVEYDSIAWGFTGITTDGNIKTELYYSTENPLSYAAFNEIEVGGLLAHEWSHQFHFREILEESIETDQQSSILKCYEIETEAHINGTSFLVWTGAEIPDVPVHNEHLYLPWYINRSSDEKLESDVYSHLVATKYCEQ